MVCIDGRPDSSELVRRAARMARRGGGPLYVLHVEPADEREPDGVHQAVEAAEQLGRQLGATVLRRAGDVAQTVVEAAGELAVNQIVLGESHRPRWKELVGQSIIARILRETDGVDVHIIADRGGRSDGPQPLGSSRSTARARSGRSPGSRPASWSGSRCGRCGSRPGWRTWSSST